MHYESSALKFLLTQTFILMTHAFWWPSSTTETPTMFKEVPLTYFRTYTYQPLGGGPMLPMPYLTNGLMTDRSDVPLMHAGRYDNFEPSFSNLKNVYASPISPFLTKYQNPLMPNTRKPITTRSTTTTTTTTTPAPTTTIAAPREQFYGDYPMYNRRQYFGNYPTYQRQPYPYPNYQNYQNIDSGNSLNYMDGPGGGSIPFMSCICPAVGVGKTENTRGFPFPNQSRSSLNVINLHNVVDDTESDLPQETQSLPIAYQKTEEVLGTSTEIPRTEKNALFSGKTMPL